MHSQAVAEYAYFQNMHSHGFSLCRLSKIVEKSSDCRPLVLMSFYPRDAYGVLDGLCVLYDDRKVSAGKKFQDVDLLGIPVRLVLTRKLFEEGLIEVKIRGIDEVEFVPIEEIQERIKAISKNTKWLL